MNLARATPRELHAAFAADASKLLREFEGALGSADAPLAGRALGGIRIGAEFLGLQELAQACRDIDAELQRAPPTLRWAAATRLRHALKGWTADPAPLHAAHEASSEPVAIGEAAPGLPGSATPATLESGTMRPAARPSEPAQSGRSGLAECVLEVVLEEAGSLAAAEAAQGFDLAPEPEPEPEPQLEQPRAWPELAAACRWDAQEAALLLQQAFAPLQRSLEQTRECLDEQRQDWGALRKAVLRAVEPARSVEVGGQPAPPAPPVPREPQPSDTRQPASEAIGAAAGDGAWDGLLEVQLGRLGAWIVALPEPWVLGVVAAPARSLQLPRGSRLVVGEQGAVPEVGLGRVWQLGEAEAATQGDDAFLLIGQAQAACALRVEECLGPSTLHFWSLPQVLGAPLGVVAAAVLDSEAPAAAACAPPRLALLIDPHFVVRQLASAQPAPGDAAAGGGGDV